ncbi:MAG TPA: DUF4097 family beta strand repeat-containing protein [Candidatus Tumulicola sp.]|jgi:hypothetical protein
MSRASIVGMLIAAEIVIVGIALFALHGGRRLHAMHEAAFTAKPIAAIAAGNAPRISADDPQSRIVVGTSSDGLVHVKDLTSDRGVLFSDRADVHQLEVKRTLDGVAISRPDSPGFGFALFGSIERRVEIDAPAGSHVDIARCAGADVSGIAGGVAVHSQDGRIALADLQGTVDGRSDSGSVSAIRVHGDSLALQSGDGHLSLRDVSVGALNARTDDGSIEASDVAVAGASPHAVLHSGDGSIRLDGSFAPGGTYEVSTNDGSIRVGLPPNADLTVDASTADGRVLVDGSPFERGDGDAARHTVKLGNGSGNLRVSSDDGSIHILTNGAV